MLGFRSELNLRTCGEATPQVALGTADWTRFVSHTRRTEDSGAGQHNAGHSVNARSHWKHSWPPGCTTSGSTPTTLSFIELRLNRKTYEPVSLVALGPCENDGQNCMWFTPTISASWPSLFCKTTGDASNRYQRTASWYACMVPLPRAITQQGPMNHFVFPWNKPRHGNAAASRSVDMGGTEPFRTTGGSVSKENLMTLSAPTEDSNSIRLIRNMPNE